MAFALLAALTFTYDAAGNRTRVQDSLGGVTTSVFDAKDRLVSRQQAVSGGAEVRIDWEYTAAGSVGTITRYDDIAGTTKVSDTRYTYDDMQKLMQQVDRDGGGATLMHATYMYDLNNRLVDKIDNGTSTSYAYDGTDQVIQDGTTTYTYDATGNRTNDGYITDVGNRLVSDGLWTWTYDAAGNTVKRSQGSSAETYLQKVVFGS